MHPLTASPCETKHRYRISLSVMARANLNIETRINEEFLRAHDGSAVRLLKVKIEDENLVLDGVVSRVSSPAQDFDTILLDSVQDNQAMFIIYRAADEIGESSPWVLITWVPDGCRVRDKMLYSSSKEDLKRSIGLSLFRAEYAANQRGDLTWKQFQSSQDRSVGTDVLTESERLVLEEKVRVSTALLLQSQLTVYRPLLPTHTHTATSASGELCLEGGGPERAALRDDCRGDCAAGGVQAGAVQLGGDDGARRGGQPGRLSHRRCGGLTAVLRRL